MPSKLSDLPFDDKVQILVQAKAFSTACHLLADHSDFSVDQWALELGVQAAKLVDSLSPAQVEEAIALIDNSYGFVKSVQIN